MCTTVEVAIVSSIMSTSIDSLLRREDRIRFGDSGRTGDSRDSLIGRFSVSVCLEDDSIAAERSLLFKFLKNKSSQ